MGIASHNRGSRNISRAADEAMPAANAHADRATKRDETVRLQERVRTLERDLKRARRCIAELRRSKDARLSEAREEQARSDSAVRILCRIAFPRDTVNESLTTEDTNG